jgi:hypothetical protein
VASASPSLAPLGYPPLGDPIEGVELAQVQALTLPDGFEFVGVDALQRPFHRALVVTLTYPLSLSKDEQTEVRTAFNRLIESMYLG